jgi:hypothetical protein
VLSYRSQWRKLEKQHNSFRLLAVLDGFTVLTVFYIVVVSRWQYTGLTEAVDVLFSEQRKLVHQVDTEDSDAIS